MYIYIDVLIITNIYANFFLLKTTARLVHNQIKNRKCIIGALIGSIFSLVILLPPLNAGILLIIRILSAIVMILVTFSGKTPKELYRIGLIFFFVCFIFAGIEYGLSVLSNSQNIIWHNSTLYVNISLITLVISTIISYAVISFFRYYIDSRNCIDSKFSVIITLNEKTISINAVADTCNNLIDTFTGKPVIICSKISISKLFTENEIKKIFSCEHINGWRLIPFSTINTDGLLPIFKPEKVIIKNEENMSYKSPDVFIGVVDKTMEYAIFNPKIL